MTPTPIVMAVEHAGTAVSAVSGVLAAQGKKIDLFGVLVLAIVTAFGGGTVRDLMLGDTPVAWLRGPGLLVTAALTAIISFLFARHFHLANRALLVADAFALAFFVMLGTRKGLAFGVSPPVAVLLGVATGVAGGIARDVLTGEVPIIFRAETPLYATAALAGSALFVLTVRSFGEELAMLLGSTLVLILRYAAVRWKWSLPAFRSH
jgi:uncharacterized membrane protein YeiH